MGGGIHKTARILSLSNHCGAGGLTVLLLKHMLPLFLVVCEQVVLHDKTSLNVYCYVEQKQELQQ